MNNATIETIVAILRPILFLAVLLQVAPLLIWLERKASAWIQDRPGPERAHVGPFRLGGLLHVVSDAVKLITKEDTIPAGANKAYFIIAPIIMVIVGLSSGAIIPMWDTIHMPNGGPVIPGQSLPINVGILWFFAIVSLSVYGVIFAGWSSNNKYSLMGAMRASAAVLSYEIPMGLAVIGTVLYYGTIDPQVMAQMQGGTWWGWLPKWGIFVQPVAAVIFLICAFAEANRVPFDIAEAESELVAGYHTEYSGMRFGSFFLAEYCALIVSGSMIVTMYFGGWQIPWIDTAGLITHAKVGTLWVLGGLFTFALVLTALFLGYFKSSIGRWKDMRDYEGLIFALGALGGAATALLLFFVVMAIDLPAWYGPIFAAVVQFHAFVIKMLFFGWVFVWVRWSLPRFRYDQVMNLGWRSLLPLALANIVLTGLLIMVLKA